MPSYSRAIIGSGVRHQSSLTPVTGYGTTVMPTDAEVAAAEKITDLETWDAHQDRIRHGDPNKRTFNYVVLGGARLMGATAARLMVVKFLASWNPAADVLALANLEVDLGAIEEGTSVIVKWRGKPVFIRHRTADEIASAEKDDSAELRDPQKDAERVQKSQYLVLLGVCTHLGCVPIGGAGDFGGWFCPCHGSHYDISGRIRKGPAPYNLEVPPYTYMTDEKLSLG